MGNRIKVEFEVHEALLAMGRLTDLALEASKLAAISTGEEHEIAKLSAKLLARASARISAALYPDNSGTEYIAPPQ